MSTVETIKEFFVHSGAEWVLWLLFALSCLSLGVALERFILFRQKSDDLRGLVGTLDGGCQRFRVRRWRQWFMSESGPRRGWRTASEPAPMCDDPGDPRSSSHCGWRDTRA